MKHIIKDARLCEQTGKIMFASKQKAYAHAKKMQYGKTLDSVYKCKFCKSYHLSHGSRQF